MNNYSPWARHQSAERIRASGVRICAIVLVVCYFIALGEMLGTMFSMPLPTVCLMIVFIHVVVIVTWMVFWLLLTELLPWFWNWIRGY